MVWVDGNHEAFAFGHSIASAAAECSGATPLSSEVACCSSADACVFSALDVAPNVTFLGAGETLRVGHTLFVGCCAWWDFQYAAPECDPAACRDRFNTVALPQLWFTAAPADGAPFSEAILAAAERDYTGLRDAIAAAQSDGSVRHIVVATHTVPHHTLLRKGVYPKDLEDAAMYGSSLMEKIPEVDTAKKIALWVFGHSHAGGDARIGHIQYLGHPRGRPDDYGRAAYCPRVVNVGTAAAPAPDTAC